MTNIRVLILDDNLESLTTPLEKALEPFLEPRQRLPPFVGRETQPIPLKVADETVECSFSFSTSKDASAVVGQVLDGRFKSEVDLVLLDSDWQNERHAGSQKVLPAILNSDSGIVGPGGLLPFIALFTGYWKDTWEEFCSRLETMAKDRQGTEFRFDGLQKEDYGRLRLLFRTVIQTALLKEKTHHLAELKKFDLQRPFVGTGEKMDRVFGVIEKYAANRDSTVLVCGETGTGKELVARALHYKSGRKHAPFVALNCAAVPSSLAESELFGHEKGAFTGATSRRLGRFRQAEGGTIFLDEIASLELPLQAKLLRVLQDKVVQAVGADSDTRIDVRVIAGTNLPLHECVKHGRFREDLYYRLNVLEIDLPPLRERREDIPALIAQFLSEKAAGRTITLEAEARRLLEEYAWPGNVRQLENVIQRACVLCEGDVVKTNDLPPDIIQGRDSARRTKPTATSDDAMHESAQLRVASGRMLWEILKHNGFKLWKILDVETVRKQTGDALAKAVFVENPACPRGSRVGLMAVDSASQIPGQGHLLTIVAKVGGEGVLHIRVFDAKGQQVVSKAETALLNKRDALQDLKRLLENFWDGKTLTDAQQKPILDIVTVITAGITRESAMEKSKATPRLVGFVPPSPFCVEYIDLSSGEKKAQEIKLEPDYHPEPNYIRHIYEHGRAEFNTLSIVRAAVCRYAAEKKKRLEEAFGEMTETVITDAIRFVGEARRCVIPGAENLWKTESKGSNGLFRGYSAKLKHNPETIHKEIRKYFPDFESPLI